MRAVVILAGTCGIGRSQRQTFRDQDAVEIQETFYRPVAVERATRWKAAAGEGFVFTVKASQFITHAATSPTYRRSGRAIPKAERAAYGGFQDSAQVREGWEATRAVAEALAATVLVFQTPESFGPSPEHLAAVYRFFESAETSAVRAWEPRGSWASHVVEKVCEDLELVHAVDPFATEPATYGLAYFRLHGSPPGRQRYRYTYLEEDLERLKSICDEYDDAYAMFNNFSMAEDAKRFRALITRPPAQAHRHHD